MRLVEMGVEPFLVTSALDCVVAQRLARRLCDKCKEQYQPTEAELIEAGWADRAARRDRLADPLPRRSAAAPAARPATAGRFAIHEVMLVTEEIERLIIERRSTEDIKKVAIDAGDDHAAPGRPAQGRRRA